MEGIVDMLKKEKLVKEDGDDQAPYVGASKIEFDTRQKEKNPESEGTSSRL